MAFEALLTPADAKPTRWRRIMLIVSLAVHGLALAIGVAHSLWQVEELPLPAVEVTLTAAAPPPPPPPPPPPAAKKAATEKARTQKTAKLPEELVQPSDEPKPSEDPEPESSEESEEAGEQGGVRGGVAGGARGGVLGGVVGGVKPKTPPPPPKPRGPKQVSGAIGRQQLLINPNVAPYRVQIPRALARTGGEFSALLHVCVSANGRVTSVRIRKGAGAAIDSQIPTVIGRWRYRPLTIGGQPTPFCYPLNYRISAR